MTATAWSPNPVVVPQVNVSGTLKDQLIIAADAQRVFHLTNFAFAANTGSLWVIKNGKTLSRTVDFMETDGATVLLTSPCVQGDQLYFVGFVGITGTVGTDPVLRADLLSNTGGANVKVKHPNASSIARSVQDEHAEIIKVEKFGAVGDGVTDDTAAFNAAISASSKNGGFGTVYIQSGKCYKITQLNIDGVIGLTIKGANGGNVGNLAPNSTGGASMIYCSAAAGDGITFTGQAYHASSITFEDVVIVANTPGYAMVFNNVSQINFNRVAVTNAGGTTYNTGNGIHFSNCYYVYGDKLYVWKTGTLYSVGAGITIDKGALTDFLGGEFNFYNCSISSFYSGLVGGNRNNTASGNEHYANINYINSEVQGCSEGIVLFYGVISAVVRGCYLEGNLGISVGVYNKATSVTIADNFFNGFSSSTADIELGQNGSGVQYTQFYNVHVNNNAFFNVNVVGVKSFAGAGSNVDVSGNVFYTTKAGAAAISLAEAVAGNLNAKSGGNSARGFTAGSAYVGVRTSGEDNYEYDATGTLLRVNKRGAINYAAFVDFTQIQPNDPETTIINNTTAGARYINASVATARFRRQFVTLTAASTFSVRLMSSDTGTVLATVLPGKGAMMWNDGTNEYATAFA